MEPLSINDQIAKLQREIAGLQTKRRTAESDEDYQKIGQLQAKIVDLGKQIDKLAARLGRR